MLELRALSALAGAFRLSDIDLVVAPGECHAVLGPSGAGKTTLLNAVLGVQPLERGAILLDGSDISWRPIEQRGLGYVPQQIGLFPHLSVRDNLQYSARARRIPRRTFQPFVDQLVAEMEIGALLDRRPATLSGGERQRVGLVRALASRPRLVLLDEPFTALGATMRRDLWRLTRQLQREYELTVLLVTHDLAEAFFLANRVSILIEGRMVQQADTATAFRQPATPEVARFLGVDNLQPGRIVAESHGLVTVQVGSARLTALAPSHPADHVLVSIRGEDVIVALSHASASSARNGLDARVVSIQPDTPMMSIDLDVGFPLRVQITRSACEELGLRPGLMLKALIKAPAIHLIPTG